MIYFKKAQDASKLEWSVTGVLGRRTKFQQFDTSQLAIVASSGLDIENDVTTGPLKLDLNDETLLEKTNFINDGDSKLTEQLKANLNPIDQSILLAFWYISRFISSLNVKNTNPVDGLTTEQMTPYVTRVLENPNNWMITTMALLLRSRLEADRSRTVERSCLQLQALVDQWQVQDNDASAATRMKHVFSLLIPSKWEMERELGLRFISIGVIRSALEIFERLEMWENVISCHQMLEQPKKAEDVIMNQLELYPTSPKFTCLLGDVKGDHTLYLKAWEHSGGKFARAMRSLAAYYYSMKQWKDSIECYEKAFLINPMFENSWFIMGCAALQIEEFPTAIKAFSRCTQIEPSV